METAKPHKSLRTPVALTPIPGAFPASKRLIDAYFRSVLLGQSAGFGLVAAGVVLVVLGLTGAIDVQIGLGTIKGWLKNASPGIVLCVLGIALLAYYKPTTKSLIKRAVDKSKETAAQDVGRFTKEELQAIIQPLLQTAIEHNSGSTSLATQEAGLIAEVVLGYLMVRGIHSDVFIAEELTELRCKLPSDSAQTDEAKQT
jgi:hypothetical protein